MNPGRDGLTGLPNREAFLAKFQETLDSAQSSGSIASVALVDIDHFKRVNDQFGHNVGDLVIKHAAELLSRAATGGALACRYGGEEFVLLLPNTEREQAFLRVEQMRVAMQEPIATDSDVLEPVTISAGVAAYPTDGNGAAEVLRKADQALFRAKSTGRNKICIAEEEKMAPKTTHYTRTQLERLAALAKEEGVGEATLLREALDDLLTKYKVSDVES